jgi:hypothetical protein
LVLVVGVAALVIAVRLVEHHPARLLPTFLHLVAELAEGAHRTTASAVRLEHLVVAVGVRRLELPLVDHWAEHKETTVQIKAAMLAEEAAVLVGQPLVPLVAQE